MHAWKTVLCVYIMLFDSSLRVQSELDTCTKSSDVYQPDAYEVIQQRNRVSQALNSMREILAQIECDKGATGRFVSLTGGWCHDASQGANIRHLHMFDEPLAEALSVFLEGKTVASFGDGVGDYKTHILKSGRVPVFDSYDGAPFSSTNTEGHVKFLDLTLEQFGLRAYDWVVSLEVLEHISGEYEDIVLSNIVRHAKEGIVLSWAKVGQPGFQHVNCKNIDYVLKVMGELGFERDEEASESLRAQAKLSWMQENVNVYLRREDSPFLEYNV